MNSAFVGVKCRFKRQWGVEEKIFVFFCFFLLTCEQLLLESYIIAEHLEM